MSTDLEKRSSGAFRMLDPPDLRESLQAERLLLSAVECCLRVLAEGLRWAAKN